MTADHRSIVPSIPGVPWWAAVVLAVTGTAAGFAFDAGSGKELTTVFSALYVAGCVAAVLAVRQSGVFTAVIQPPLILFCAVPGRVLAVSRRQVHRPQGPPDQLRLSIDRTLPADAVHIGRRAGDRYHPLVAGDADPPGRDRDSRSRRRHCEGRCADRSAWRPGWRRCSSVFRRPSADDERPRNAAKPGSRRTHAVGRSAKPTRSADSRRTARRPAASRSRHIRPPLEEAADPTLDRARRPGVSARRAPASSTLRATPPRQGPARSGPAWPAIAGDPPRPALSQGSPTVAAAASTPPSRSSDAPYETEAPPEPRRRPVPNGTTGATATHHPISQVRYRGSTSADEPRSEPTSRPRRLRESAADSWDYDV